MNGDDFIPLIGRTADDSEVKKFLASCGIKKQPKLPRGEMDAYLENVKKGIEITFRDERHLDVKTGEYEEGALVLWCITMYGDDDEFEPFNEKLPSGLKFNFGLKDAIKKLGKKPAWEDQEMGDARWDFDGYCVFITFDEDFEEIFNIAIQLPVE